MAFVGGGSIFLMNNFDTERTTVTVERKKTHRVHPLIKRLVNRIGVGGTLYQGYVETLRLGERAQNLWGTPDPGATILLAGSGRSGTTWLTETLTYKTGVQAIFEPMIPLWNREVRYLTGWDDSDPHIRSFYLRAEAHDPAWRALLWRILAGQYRNYWTEKERTAFFPKRLLVKEIRMNLMLGYVYKHFQPTILYLVRHPCAVVASRLHAAWHADVQDILRQEALVEDYLRPWVREIEQERDPVGAHAVWWAVENFIAIRQLARIPHLMVTYEEIALFPELQAQRILAYVDLPIPEGLCRRMEQPSITTSAASGRSTQSRLSAWQRYFAQDDQRRILSWAQRMGLQMYSEAVLPVGMRAPMVDAT